MQLLSISYYGYSYIFYNHPSFQLYSYLCYHGPLVLIISCGNWYNSFIEKDSVAWGVKEVKPLYFIYLTNIIEHII